LAGVFVERQTTGIVYETFKKINTHGDASNQPFEQWSPFEPNKFGKKLPFNATGLWTGFIENIRARELKVNAFEHINIDAGQQTENTK